MNWRRPVKSLSAWAEESMPPLSKARLKLARYRSRLNKISSLLLTRTIIRERTSSSAPMVTIKIVMMIVSITKVEMLPLVTTRPYT